MTDAQLPVSTRPESNTLAKVSPAGTVMREPWELQDRLGRNKLIEWVLKKRSGHMANTTEEFQNYHAGQIGMNVLGYANEAELAVLDEKMANSGDLQGKNKMQGIQLLEEKGVLIPGSGYLYPAAEQQPGFVDKVKSLFGGGK
jgi:hypothetical protein